MPIVNSKSLVLILGAGSSDELGLPIGNVLKDQIAAKLNYKVNKYGNGLEGGDENILNAFRKIVNGNFGKHDLNSLHQASTLISTSMPLSDSIDNFIDSHRHNATIALCAKLAITQCILEAERHSKIMVSRDNINNKLDFKSVSNTWFSAFFKTLIINCDKNEIKSKLKNIAIISFNYDRCIEEFLYMALRTYYGISPDDAAEILSELEIYHPYGKVGNLPWMKASEMIDYGATPNAHELIKIAESIKTFTESSNEISSDIVETRNTLANAGRVVFLGFAFHPLNLDLLFPDDLPKNKSTKSIYATGVGLSTDTIKVIQEELALRANYQEEIILIAHEKTCSDLLYLYKKRLSLG